MSSLETQAGPEARFSVPDLRRSQNREPLLHRKVINATTVNETRFFRDYSYFISFQEEILPRLMRTRDLDQSLNIWSAACATGQEAYSIAMILQQHYPALAEEAVIYASALSFDCLCYALAGRYNQFEINRGLPIAYLLRYFEQEGKQWRIKHKVRDRVRFQAQNLIQAWENVPAMDVIFLRNVLSYFDAETRQAVLARIRSQLKPRAYLFLGAEESAAFSDEHFVRVGKAFQLKSF